MEEARDRLAGVVRDSGLIDPASKGVALLSGGPDSACLAAGLARFVGAPRLSGLHLNYGLREDSDEDETACRELCARLGIELAVERVSLPEGNLQAAARDVRYAAAERLRASKGGEWIATGHTRTDLAETMIYRLASSPGRRGLLGLPPRRGRVVRPLLRLGREQTRELAAGAGLPFRDDPSNLDQRFARVRVRREVLPVLRELNPAAEENLAATWAELAEETEALDAVASAALEDAGLSPGAVAVSAGGLAGLHPAIRRLALRSMAERAVGREVPLGRDRAEEIWRLARRTEGGEIELGGGVRVVCEGGHIRIVVGTEPEPEPVRLPVPGSCRFGDWELRAELLPAPVEPIGPDVATLDAQLLGPEVEVRTWQEGDRMRPLGLGGSKTLQDLFTDAGVPRSLRRSLPVVVSGERIAWVAGVAVSEDFRLGPESVEVAILTASAASPG
jgi:tRNA(Ile)-lysidine synthase